MYSIRYLIKKDGDQIAFWNHNAASDMSKALELAYKFASDNNNYALVNSGWIKESENFYRMKLTYASTSPEQTNFSLHVTVGLASDSGNSNL